VAYETLHQKIVRASITGKELSILRIAAQEAASAGDDAGHRTYTRAMAGSARALKLARKWLHIAAAAAGEHVAMR
jgi:hypothetical protein